MQSRGAGHVLLHFATFNFEDLPTRKMTKFHDNIDTLLEDNFKVAGNVLVEMPTWISTRIYNHMSQDILNLGNLN